MTATHDRPIVIRPAREDDDAALRRLAQLDGAKLPDGELLVAEVDGELRAALRIADRAYVADPFFPSKELVGLLDVRARRLRQQQFGRVERARTRLSLWALLWQRASATRPTA
jgi:hypothetical protein